MNTSTPSATGGVLLRATILLVLVLLGLRGELLPQARCAESAGDGRGILRYDPLSGTVVPVPKEEVKPGYIYSHFNERLNRRVWSYVQPNGEFWYALGEGTTQEGWRLDIRAARVDIYEGLAAVDPKLAREALNRGKTVYARLNGDSRWVVANTANHPSIYNLETGERWERVAVSGSLKTADKRRPSHTRYIPVVHMQGSHWVVEGGKYVPMGRRYGTAYPSQWSLAPTISMDDGF